MLSCALNNKTKTISQSNIWWYRTHACKTTHYISTAEEGGFTYLINLHIFVFLTLSCSSWRFSEWASPRAIWEVRQACMLALIARPRKGRSSCRDQPSGTMRRTRTASNTSPCRFRRSTAAISRSPLPPPAAVWFPSRYTPKSRWNSCCLYAESRQDEAHVQKASADGKSLSLCTSMCSALSCSSSFPCSVARSSSSCSQLSILPKQSRRTLNIKGQILRNDLSSNCGAKS